MMTNREDKEFLLAQREPGRRGRMGGVDSVLAAQETRQSLRLEKAAAFSARKQEKAAASLICWRSSSPRRRPAPTLQLLSQMKNTEQLEERAPAKRAKRATKNIVSPATWRPTLDRTKFDRSFRTYVLTEAARCLGQKRGKSSTSTALSIRPQKRFETCAAMAPKDQRGFGSGNSAGGPLGWQARDGPTTKEHVDPSPDHHFRDWRRPTARRRQVGSGTGESMAAAVVSAWRHGESRIR
ncbi:hypothetical protein GWK47_046933 [Chionoecetes opilio]|uniref:Uncharacterized protein n=1 Tax=Chionoecetes opilio TaxID=41210 RepID=A0A8J5CWY5_CHIOP|nr:hypothetical protein GWK47_046933 [Chionoecetes opilio]